MLVDNMSVCVSYERRRARNSFVLPQIRKLAALSLALSLQCHFRWIASEANVADEPSRKLDAPNQRRPASDVCKVASQPWPDPEVGVFEGYLPPRHGPQGSRAPVQRCEQRARLAQSFQQMSPALKAHALLCEERLAALLCGRLQPEDLVWPRTAA